MNILKKLFCVFLCSAILVSSYCTLVSYAVESDVCYDIEDGVLCVYGDGPMTAIYIDNESLVEVYIERGITSIPEFAFSGCSNLEKVTISNSVVSIGSGAFEDCSSLCEIKLSKNVSTIAEYTFSGCESLEGINIPDSVTEIECGAFYNCCELQYVILTRSVELIDVNAFKNCNSLDRLYYAGRTSDWADVSVFDNRIGNVNISFLSPEFYTEKTYSSGKMALSLRLGSGSFNALDVQLAPVGDCSIYRIQTNKNFTASNNRNTGIVSMASNDTPETGSEIVKVTYNVTNCESYSVNITFLSCTVRVEGYDVNVPAECDYSVIGGEHGVGAWSVVSYPAENADGAAETVCACCGAAIQKNLTYAFKNCEVEENIIFISTFGTDENTFISEYFLTDNSELVSSAAFVGTGSTVSVDYSDGVTLTYDVSLSGDVDSDGFCDAQDSIIIACICENMIDSDSLSRCTELASDCNKDESIDNIDAEFAYLNGIQLH